MNDMSNKFLVYVNIDKNFNQNMYDGVIKFVSSQIRKHKIEVELITAVEKNKIFQIFSLSSGSEDDYTEYNNAKKILKNMALDINTTTGARISSNVLWGNELTVLKQKILDDKTISLLILAANNNSSDKNYIKSFSSILNEIANTMMIPFIIIPHGMTDTQIERLL